MAAPILIGLAWYSWATFATIDRYRRLMAPDQKIDAELVQITLHDEIVRDLRRLLVSERDDRLRLPTVSLVLKRSSLDQLSSVPSDEGEANYVDGLLEKDGKVHEIKVRYRGDQPWHVLGTQRSMKIRL